MKRIIATMSAVLCLAAAANAGDAKSHGASSRNLSSKSQTILLGVDGDFAAPISSAYSTINGIGGGALLNVEYPMMEQLSLTGRVGFEFHGDATPAAGASSHVHNIPVLLGAKYYLMETDRQGLFAAGEMGLFALMSSVSVGAASGSSTDMKFGIGAGLGYQWNQWNVRVNLHSHDVGNFADFLVVSGGVGYQFAGF